MFFRPLAVCRLQCFLCVHCLSVCLNAPLASGRMGLYGSGVSVPWLASWSAISFPWMPEWPGTQVTITVLFLAISFSAFMHCSVVLEFGNRELIPWIVAWLSVCMIIFCCLMSCS